MNSKLYKYLALFFYTLFWLDTAIAQTDTIILHPVNNPDLQQFAIRKICSTKDGKLWLSTDRGVVSFDGNDVQLFSHDEKDSNSIRFSSIMKCYPDSKGNLYVVMVGTGIDYFDTKTGKATHLNIQVPSKDSSRLAFPTAYSTILTDKDETIWVGLYNLGFVHYNLRTKKTECYYLHNNLNVGRNSIYGILQDIKNDEILWLSTEDGIFFFNKKTKELKRSFHCSNPADSSAQDLKIYWSILNNPDSIWFAVPGKAMGCYSIKNGSYTIYPQRGSEKSKDFIEININYLQYKNASEYYIGSFDSLPGVFNTRTHKYSFAFKTIPSLPFENTSAIRIDSLGNYWCSLWDRLYIGRSPQNKFSTIKITDQYYKKNTRNIFKAIVWNEKTKCYYAAFDMSDGIFVLDSNFRIVKSITEEVLNSNSPVTRVLDAGIDKNEHLWLSNINLSTYDSVSKRMVLTEKVFPNLKFADQRFQNLIFRGDYLYLQPSNLQNQALYRINVNNLTYDSIAYPEEMIEKKEFDNNGKTFNVAEIDKESKYAYVAYHYNLFQFNLTTKKIRKIISLPDSLKPYQHQFNMSWYKLDDSNHLWVATNTHISIYETEKLHLLKRINLEKGAYILQLSNIDDRNIMCVSYSGGILLFDYKNHTQFHLTANDGLVSETMNLAISCVNRILFTGYNYLQYIPLDNIIKKNLNRSCYLSEIKIFDRPYSTDTLPEYLHSLSLPHDKNFIQLRFSSTEFEQPERLEYRYKLEGVNQEWINTNYLNRTISYNDLTPGRYFFHTSIKNADGTWSNNQTVLQIIIVPAWWQTSWFKILSFVALFILICVLVRWRIKIVRKQEQRRGSHEKELLELEAKALRAQMNPHFIFNCMNSLKSLIQKKEEDKAVNYLTTFSKLIRTIFQNSDKREISLFDEIETGRLYTQLESMRFDNKFSYSFSIDNTIDLKSLLVPALILQPFIENAIWHGIIPKQDDGNISITVEQNENGIYCIIDDNGIGREISMQNKFKGDASTHQSKGVHLTQSRLDLDNLINERNASLKIIDKKDDQGKATGTTVILIFKAY
ncbi:histidine kinase [soil metagenome]